MRVSRRPHRRISHWRKIEREQAFFPELQVVENCQFHDEVMRVLAIHDGHAKRGFTLLEQFWIEAIRDCAWLEAEHGAYGKFAGSELALRHRHHPVCGEYLVG